MRTYYLFWIDDVFYHSYLQNPDSLYRTLEKFYTGNIHNVSLALSLYRQICKPHKIDFLSSYLHEICYKEKENRYLLIQSKRREKTFICLRPSFLLLKSNKNVPSLFWTLSYYSPHLFVCDFENGDYFWLTSYLRRK